MVGLLQNMDSDNLSEREDRIHCINRGVRIISSPTSFTGKTGTELVDSAAGSAGV